MPKFLRSIRDVFDEQARRKPLAFAAGAGDAAGYGIWMGVFSPFVRCQMWMQALPMQRRRDADTTSYVADYLTRSVRRASSFVLVGDPETIW